MLDRLFMNTQTISLGAQAGGRGLGIVVGPESASTFAGKVDALYYFMVGLTVFLSLAIALAITFFAVRYRAGAKVNRKRDFSPANVRRLNQLEIAWSVIPFIIVMIIFFWAARVFFTLQIPPKDAMEVFVVAKQWMWKFQHPSGTREINALHVPVGQAVRLTMTSQDVIHSFYVPAFRIKQDVLPNRTTTIWFQATKVGSYHLFCAEYCGTNHSRMTGTIVVMEAQDYQRWLARSASTLSMAAEGERVFVRIGCSGCHDEPGNPRAPNLRGVWGRPVVLDGERTVLADRQYIQDSIMLPRKDLVAGYQPIMPTFSGILSQEQVMQLIEYIKSLSGQSAPGGTRP